MKKTILTLLLAVASFGLFAQSIQYKQTSITITNDGGFCSSPSNSIRVHITSNVADADTLLALFPQYASSFTYVNGKMSHTFDTSMPTMWDILFSVKIEQMDVGKYIGDATIRWSTNLIYQLNLLELENINDWGINE